MGDNTIDLRYVGDLAVKAAAGDICTVIDGEDIGVGSGKPYTFVPDGMKVVDLEPYMKEPRRIRQIVNFHDMPSFVKYIKDFRQQETEIFFDDTQATFTAWIDYHLKPTDLFTSVVDTTASWRTHTVIYKVRLSREWQAWAGMDRKPTGQLEFAEFLEEHVRDCFEPSGAEILEMVDKFEATRDVAFSSRVERTSSSVQFSYTEENRSGGAELVEFPKKMKIRIPILFGEAAQEIDLRLKWRIRENKLSLWFEMVDRAYILENAFKALISKIENAETGLGMTILRGVA